MHNRDWAGLFARLSVCCLILLAALQAAAQPPPSVQARRDLVVFDFESTWDDGLRGRWVATTFRGHALRRGTFTVPDPISFEEALGAVKVAVTMQSAPGDIAAVARDSFGADLAIWGKVEKLDADQYRLHVRAVDLKKSATTLALDKAYTATKHGLQISVDRALDELTGKARPKKKDVLSDRSYLTRTNLCINGDFEQGEITPAAWEQVDGLATFWVDGVSPAGKCLMIDTNVLESQYTDWRKRFVAGAPAAQAPKKQPTKPPYYDTIGGTIGAHLYSDPIPIKQGPTYRVDLDVRGRGSEVKLFVKGYADFATLAGDKESREVYRAQVNLRKEAAGFTTSQLGTDWDHYATVFHPTQPLYVMAIASDFDDGETGVRLRELIVAQLSKGGAIEMKDADKVLDRLKGVEESLRFETPEREVFTVVRERLGRGVVVWGDVAQENGELNIRLRGMDVRTGGTSGSMTKVWRASWKCTADQLSRKTEEIVTTVLEKARVVTHLRLDIDAYWPVGEYYFDNAWLTEEPAEPPKELD